MNAEMKDAAVGWLKLGRERAVFERWWECARGGMDSVVEAEEVDSGKRLWEAAFRVSRAVEKEQGSEVTCCARAAAEHMKRLVWAARGILENAQGLMLAGVAIVVVDDVRRLKACFVACSAVVDEIIGKASPGDLGDDGDAGHSDG